MQPAESCASDRPEEVPETGEAVGVEIGGMGDEDREGTATGVLDEEGIGDVDVEGDAIDDEDSDMTTSGEIFSFPGTDDVSGRVLISGRVKGIGPSGSSVMPAVEMSNIEDALGKLGAFDTWTVGPG